MIVLAPPVPAEMVVAIGQAIKLLPQVDPFSMHNRVKLFGFYFKFVHLALRNLLMFRNAKDYLNNYDIPVFELEY